MGNDSITFLIHNSYLSASEMPLVLLSFQKYTDPTSMEYIILYCKYYQCKGFLQ